MIQIILDTTAVTGLAISPREYDIELDDVRSILVDVCDAIAREGRTRFCVSGFGDDAWRVGLGIHLAVFLEQLPNALTCIGERASFSIDFYEQGLERYIHFNSTAGDRYEATCRSYSTWQPSVPVESIARAQIEQMLRNCRESFVTLLGVHLPDLARHPWIIDWKGHN